jgi:hypothetical protein
VDFDAVLLLVFPDECKEGAAGVVGVQDRRVAVTPPRAVVGRILPDEKVAVDPAHAEAD